MGAVTATENKIDIAPNETRKDDALSVIKSSNTKFRALDRVIKRRSFGSSLIIRFGGALGVFRSSTTGLLATVTTEI